MTFIRAVPGQPIEYPYSLHQLQSAVLLETDGNTIISTLADPTAFVDAPFYLFPLVELPAPVITDPRTERLEESPPELQADGTWQQVWSLRTATTEEIAGYDAQFVSAPDWQGAFQALVQELLPPDRYQDVAAQFNLPVDSQQTDQQQYS